MLEGSRRVTGSAGLKTGGYRFFVHGFTVGTNAFLACNGAKVAVVVSDGVRDVLEIGDQLRPHLYRMTQTKPLPVVPRSRVVEADERLDAFGKEAEVLIEDDVESDQPVRLHAAVTVEADELTDDVTG